MFDMEEHNSLLKETEEEVRGLKEKQKRAQDEMGRHEEELMARWVEEKKEGKVPGDRVEELLSGLFSFHIILLSLTSPCFRFRVRLG